MRRELLVIIGVFLLGATACTTGLRREVSTLRGRVFKLQKELARVDVRAREARNRADALQRRLGRVEGALREAKAARATPDPRTAPVPTARPLSNHRCPAALPAAAHKIRRKMSHAEVTRLLAGTVLRESKAITLTGAGTRTRRILDGPCFRITFQKDRVTEVALEGVMPRRPPHRGRRRRRRRR